jgi:hypothetical protein
MLPRLLRYLTIIELFVLAVAGIGLFFVAGPMGRAWPWALTPFTTRFLGAVYLTALVAAALLLLLDRWVPARITLWELFSFTAIVFVISVVELDRFEFDRPAAWAWFPLYLVLPVNTAYHLWRYRSVPMPPPVPAGRLWTLALRAFAAIFGIYSLGLLVLPATFTEFWPWPVDDFHARMYSAPFVTVAVGLFLASRSARPLDFLNLGLIHGTLGSLAIIGLLVVDTDRDSVDWSAAGTWLWVGAFTALFGLSLAMIVEARPVFRALPIPKPYPDRDSTIARWFALVFAVTFIAAGVSGFIPAFTTDPPADAHHVEITTAYGYLLGLYPVNILHSLLHLGFGIAALAALAGRIEIGRYARAMAAILTVLTVMGLIPGLWTTFGLLPLFGHDVWLHAIEAAIAAYVGFVVCAPAPAINLAPQSADGD